MGHSSTDIPTRIARRARYLRDAVCPAAVALALAMLLAVGSFPVSAHAETDNIDGTADELQVKVEEASARYEEVQSELAALEQSIEDNTARLAEIQEQLPAQQEKSSDSLVALYKLSNESSSLINLLLSAGSLGDFLSSMEYVTHIAEKHNAELEALSSLSREAAQKQEELSDAYSQIEDRRTEAKAALDEAVAAHEEAVAIAQAKAEADALAAQEAAAKLKAESAVEDDSEEDGTEDESPDSGFTTPVSDGVTGTETREEFVSEWAGRIDAYLAGSALAGQGTAFAEAAWDYNVDPRFSPAISCIESSKGDVCFRNHNAWGWGSIAWDSWEEAIRSHVSGLARGYGYTVSMEGAQKYCPPNWAFWYSRVSEEMNKI